MSAGVAVRTETPQYVLRMQRALSWHLMIEGCNTGCAWSATEASGVSVHCRLEVSEEGQEWREAWRGLGTSARISGLRPGRAHRVRVVASNAVGEGAFSKTAAFTTLLLAPPAPAQLQAEATEE